MAESHHSSLRASADFYERLASREQFGNARPRRINDLTELGVTHIAGRDPDDLRRRPVPVEQSDKVFILGDDDRGFARASGVEDHRVVRTHEPDVNNVDGLDAVLAGKPPRKRRRQLGIDPHRTRQHLGCLARSHRLCRDIRMVEPARSVQ